MLDKLKVAQNKVLRIIAGQYQSTSLEALREEAGADSYLTVSTRKCSVSYERASRLPLSISASEPSIARWFIGWRGVASVKEPGTALRPELQLCAPVTFTQQAPWISSAGTA